MNAFAHCDARQVAHEDVARVRASLELDFALDHSTGRTVLHRSKQQSPLRVVRAFTLADGSALAHLHNISGGVLGGDDLALKVDVGPVAAAQLTTTSATRVYRARACNSDAVQTTTVTVDKNALLEYLPDPIIPFAGARLRQQTTIHLSAGAGLFWWEILAPGREARGELFAYDHVELRTEVHGPERRIAVENVRLDPNRRDLTSPARMGPYRYWATFYICRVGEDAKRWLLLEEQLRELACGFARPNQARWAVSTLSAHGVVVRGLLVHGRDALDGVSVLWRAAKLELYGREAISPRKIH